MRYEFSTSRQWLWVMTDLGELEGCLGLVLKGTLCSFFDLVEKASAIFSSQFCDPDKGIAQAERDH